MEEETCSRRGSEGGDAFKKLLLPRGVQFSQVIIFGGGEIYDRPHFSEV